MKFFAYLYNIDNSKLHGPFDDAESAAEYIKDDEDFEHGVVVPLDALAVK